MVILSDLSEVLINGVTKVGEVITERYGEGYGARYEERFEQNREVFHDLLRGRITEDTFFSILLRDGHWPFDSEHLEQIYADEFKKKVPDTLSVYRRIVAHPHSFSDPIIDDGIPEVDIVSDHIFEHIWAIEHYHKDIFRFTWDSVWSCDLGMIKRDPGFFPKALEKLKLDINKCVFVDDTIENIVAAEAAGITSIHFQDAKQLEEDLTALGFKFRD